MSKPFRLVILDDELQTAKDLAASLSSDGVVAYPTQDLDEVRELISLLQHDVLLIDVEQLVRAPIYALQALRQVNPDLKVVGMSHGSCGDGRLLRELLGLDAYLQEPVTPEALITCVPEIADRYLMVSFKKVLDKSSNL